jgi:MYXO-CTERM domain-containing protein
VIDYRAEVAGPEARAVHVIDATDRRGEATRRPISGDGWSGVALDGVRDAVVVWPTRPAGADGAAAALSYRAPRRRAVSHVVLDAPATGGKARVTARADGDACLVTVEPGGPVPAAPVIVTLDARCAVAVDPEASRTEAPASSPASPPERGERGERAGRPRTWSHGGCCAAGGGAATPIAMAMAVVVFAPRRRRRR